MAENLTINKSASKEEKYISLIPQLRALLSGEQDFVANLANTAAVLKEIFGFFWVGFYLVKNNQLVLGPFQGSIACTRINFGKGVCGASWQTEKTIIVDDVELFPGHIACSSLSKSEIVVPLIYNSNVIGVLDVDSDKLSDFDATDKKYLEDVAEIIVRCYELRYEK
ncbi:MAG: GAF domain-containing protein [Bacteroidota bacterium]